MLVAPEAPVVTVNRDSRLWKLAGSVSSSLAGDQYWYRYPLSAKSSSSAMPSRPSSPPEYTGSVTAVVVVCA